ncbi:MAG: nucleotidyl transferase AbiEii/AbiGii toxin family protein [Planctomycetes bacterium]|nr:nucleotidyl transferase AbiEii/AbiGii toxin family protein [Planctomycetota bacterium]
MGVTDLVRQVSIAFDDRKLPWLVIGGLALSWWLPERLTRDVDIVVPAWKRHAGLLKQALMASGARVTALEMRWLFERRFVLLKTGGPRLDVHISRTPHDRAALAQAVPGEFGDRKVPVATPEDLVLYKLKAWRLQDRADIDRLLKEVRDLRRDYIESWLDSLSTETGSDLRARWAEALKEAAK